MSDLLPCAAPGFIDRQREDLPALTRIALEAVRDGVPYYASLSRERTEPTAGAIARALSIVLDCWEAGRLPEEDDVAEFPIVSVVEGSVMRPMQAVLRAWRIGTAGVHRELIDRGSGVLSAEDVAGLSVITMSWVHRVSDAVTGAFTEAARGAGSAGEAEAARLRLLLSLVTGTYSSSEEVRRRARAQSLALPEPATVLVAEPLAEGLDPSAAIEGIRADAGLDRSRLLELTIDERSVVLMPATTEATLATAIGSGPVRGVAVSASDIGEIAAAYRIATRALAFLAPLGNSVGSLVPESEARLAALLATELCGRSELDLIVDGLGSRDAEELIATLLAFFETGSAESTAHAIGVHPQTVRYRLRGVRERTGRDPTVGWPRFALELAVRVRASGGSRG